jgi:tetratricopeptide repeat protein
VGYQHTVATTWSLALETLQQTAPAAVGLLTLAAFLAPDDLPQPLLAAHTKELPEPLAAADPLTLADAVAALRRYSLVRVIGDGLFVHRLWHTVVRTELEADAEAAWAAAAVRLVNAGFPFPSNDVATWPESERLLPHAMAVAEHGERLSVEPEAWLRLQAEAATYLWSRGQYRQAIALDEQTLTARRRLLGDDHPDTLNSTNNLATARRELKEL